MLFVEPMWGRYSAVSLAGWLEPRLRQPLSLVTPVLSLGPERGAALGLVSPDWQGSCPCPLGLGCCLPQPWRWHVGCYWLWWL